MRRRCCTRSCCSRRGRWALRSRPCPWRPGQRQLVLVAAPPLWPRRLAVGPHVGRQRRPHAVLVRGRVARADEHVVRRARVRHREVVAAAVVAPRLRKRPASDKTWVVHARARATSAPASPHIVRAPVQCSALESHTTSHKIQVVGRRPPPSRSSKPATGDMTDAVTCGDTLAVRPGTWLRCLVRLNGLCQPCHWDNRDDYRHVFGLHRRANAQCIVVELKQRTICIPRDCAHL